MTESETMVINGLLDATKHKAYQECIEIAREIEQSYKGALSGIPDDTAYAKGIAYGAYHIIQRIEKLSKGEEPVS